MSLLRRRNHATHLRLFLGHLRLVSLHRLHLVVSLGRARSRLGLMILARLGLLSAAWGVLLSLLATGNGANSFHLEGCLRDGHSTIHRFFMCVVDAISQGCHIRCGTVRQVEVPDD